MVKCGEGRTAALQNPKPKPGPRTGLLILAVGFHRRDVIRPSGMLRPIVYLADDDIHN